jgi:hypothetical protein
MTAGGSSPLAFLLHGGIPFFFGGFAAMLCCKRYWYITPFFAAIFPLILAILYIRGAASAAQERGGLPEGFIGSMIWGPILQVFAFLMGYAGGAVIHWLIAAMKPKPPESW